MSSSGGAAAKDAMRMNEQNARRFQQLGLPYLKDRNQILMEALGGEGVPSNEAGFNAQRAGMTEGLVGNQDLQIRQGLMQSKGAVMGGNTSQVMSGPQSGIASQMAQSRIQQGLADIEQKNSILQMALGGGAQTGNQAVQAGGLQLNAIQGMPQYNPWVMGGATALSGAYGVYGGLQQNKQNALMNDFFAQQQFQQGMNSYSPSGQQPWQLGQSR